MSKPFSQACENNKGPILAVLAQYFSATKVVLEIGSGTGQHGVYFAKHLQHLTWQTSDVTQNHLGIEQWIAEYPSPNILPPLPFVIGADSWPNFSFDGVFSANTTHIMQKSEARLMMKMVGEFLPMGGIFCQYGPFKQGGKYSSQSNQDFDSNLKAQGYGGIRDLEDLQLWAKELRLKHIVEMPANNVCLIWLKS